MVNNLSFHGWLSVKQASNFQSLDNPRKVEKNMPRRPQSSTINNNVGMMHDDGWGSRATSDSHNEVDCAQKEATDAWQASPLLHTTGGSHVQPSFVASQIMLHHIVPCGVLLCDDHQPATNNLSVAVAARQTTFFFSSTILTRLRCCNKQWRWGPASLNSSSLA